MKVEKGSKNRKNIEQILKLLQRNGDEFDENISTS